jgi:hypothetical protein
MGAGLTSFMGSISEAMGEAAEYAHAALELGDAIAPSPKPRSRKPAPYMGSAPVVNIDPTAMYDPSRCFKPFG